MFGEEVWLAAFWNLDRLAWNCLDEKMFQLKAEFFLGEEEWLVAKWNLLGRSEIAWLKIRWSATKADLSVFLFIPAVAGHVI